MAAAFLAVMVALDASEKSRGYDDGYDPDVERDEWGGGPFGGYDRGYEQGEADRKLSDSDG